MAIIQGSDIVFVYSGGSTNQDPSLSIGGDPSAFTITGSTNNLFDNVTNAESTDGSDDYRAFYIFNNSIDASFIDTNLFIESQVPGGAIAFLGLTNRNDSQRITIPQPVTGGTVTLSFEGDEIVWPHDPDLAVWGTNLETLLNGLSQLSEVTVSSSVISGNNVFDILFQGADGSRNQDLLVLVSNDLIDTPDIDIAKTIEGAPMNYITPTIPVDTTLPADVAFSSPTEEEPINIGTMLPLDGFPVWIRRTTPQGTQPLEDDGLVIRLIGDAF